MEGPQFSTKAESMMHKSMGIDVIGKNLYSGANPTVSIRGGRNRQVLILIDGIRVSDPSRIDVRGDISVGTDCSIDVNVILEGNIKLGDNVSIGPNTLLKDVVIGDNTVIEAFSHLVSSKIGNDCNIGPYARIRPEVRIQKGSKIGNFVEIKKSNIGKNSKVNHLSYIGDTTIGKNVNIGAGTITCNYDGVKKSKTKIKDGAFIGSNSSLVAPVTISKKSIVGASSVITKNVLSNSLALTRSNQIIIKNYKRKK